MQHILSTVFTTRSEKLIVTPTFLSPTVVKLELNVFSWTAVQIRILTEIKTIVFHLNLTTIKLNLASIKRVILIDLQKKRVKRESSVLFAFKLYVIKVKFFYN